MQRSNQVVLKSPSSWTIEKLYEIMSRPTPQGVLMGHRLRGLTPLGLRGWSRQQPLRSFTASLALYKLKNTIQLDSSLFRKSRFIQNSYRYLATMAANSESSSPSTFTLPEGFLEGPAPNITKSKIDFRKGGIPGCANSWAVVLDGVLTEEECETLLKAAEATTGGKWERAMINIGGGMQAMYEDTRKCGRIIWDTREIMEKLWARIEGEVPEIHTLQNWPEVTGNGPARRGETWVLTRLNERGRFLKYVGGEYFKGRV